MSSQTQSISASVIQAHEEIDSVKRHLHDLAETNFKHIEFNM